ncbi:hypothetical protein OPT61_g8998 [Boeremia exigua]|uniref:Uncharacterized protein n=1 Tax=Boeremia exigua TaxID=749465 RepID=A0ACC2HXL5_9PLEO|nr:hypothetical protein OPT61_g8998 [Boeremia exigua]
MMLPRAPTGYQKVHDETAYDDPDNIELSQHQRTVNHEQPLINDVPSLHSRSSLDHLDESHGRVPFRIFEVSSWRSFQQRHLTGWRMGVFVGLVGTILVCLFNIIVTIYVLSQGEAKSGYGSLADGDCKKMKILNVFAHLVINILGTLLLGASNYCMQVLSAPTRGEIVQAHAQRLWLHIGIPSFRNLRHIARDRAYVWLALLLSSMPLHLFFNSVIFTTAQANDYLVTPATEDWMSGAAYDTSGFIDSITNVAEIDKVFYRLNKTASPGYYTIDGAFKAKYNKLSTEDCFNAYDSQYLPKLGNVYIIQEGSSIWRNPNFWWSQFHSNDSDSNFTWINSSKPKDKFLGDLDRQSGKLFMWNEFGLPPLNSTPEFYQSNGWRCPSHNPVTCNIKNPNEVPTNRSQWRPFERPVQYCLAEEVREECSLNFSTSIAAVVIVSNMIKIVCMGLTLYKYRQHLPLVTLGDAIAHFLDNPDPQTKNRCLQTRGVMEAQWNWERFHNAQKDSMGVAPQQYNPQHRRWSAAPSRRRWGATYVSFIVAILFGSLCIKRSLDSMPTDIKGLWAVGFGESTGKNLLALNTNLTGGIIVANLPQVVLSYLYLAFNALSTTMLMAQEWSTYAHAQKPLRVTTPKGKQRDTYWLNMPFRYGIPLQILALSFHWLTSQSIFLVRIVVTDFKTRQQTRIISTNGFSPVAIILATSLGILIATIGLAAGSFKFPSAIPVAACCSAVISAACHPLAEDVDASTLPVQWGAVSHGIRGGDCPANMSAALPLSSAASGPEEPRVELADRESLHGESDEVEDQVGHCTFSSRPVEEPQAGYLYA